jgi:Domain of unknown function (DUF4331)
MKRPVLLALGAASTLIAALGVGYAGSGPSAGEASSHREAPLIAEDPAADNTDVYAFRSPDQPNTVTLLAQYIPLQEPAGGPNFFPFSEDVLYAVHVDNDGDAKADITYQLRFRNVTRNPGTFLYNTGPINTLSDPDWNRPQLYSVTRIDEGAEQCSQRRGCSRGRGSETMLATDISTTPANIGPRSTPSYAALMGMGVHALPGGGKVFAGQSDDPFFVDLGSVFDLAGLRPFNPAHVLPLPAEPGVDGVSGFNVNTIALQIPITQLTRDGQAHAAGDAAATIGVYASASRRAITTIAADGSRNSFGPFTQVSRLAQPLINEVVIPIPRKDYWNASDPASDEQFADRYLNPEVTVLENALYPVLDNAPETNRQDLAAILLTGIPGLNYTGPTKADLIRLNTGIPPSAPAGRGNRLAALAGDLAGFPNGRRLEDDVVDIELRAFACGYGSTLPPLLQPAVAQIVVAACGGNPNRSPNNLLGDGVDGNDRPFKASFPYVGEPHQGYAHEHAHRSPAGGP